MFLSKIISKFKSLNYNQLAMETPNNYDNQSLRSGDIVRFHSPYPDENPDMMFIILEAHYLNDNTSRAEVVKYTKELNNYFVIKKLFIRDLERVPNLTAEQILEIEIFMNRKPGNCIVSKLFMSSQ